MPSIWVALIPLRESRCRPFNTPDDVDESGRRTFKSVELEWMDVMRSYQGYYTRSHQNSEVKRLWAGIVLGWVTSREVPVLHPLFLFKSFNTLCSHVAAAYWSMPPRTDHGQPSIMFQNENS